MNLFGLFRDKKRVSSLDRHIVEIRRARTWRAKRHQKTYQQAREALKDLKIVRDWPPEDGCRGEFVVQAGNKKVQIRCYEDKWDAMTTHRALYERVRSCSGSLEDICEFVAQQIVYAEPPKTGE